MAALVLAALAAAAAWRAAGAVALERSLRDTDPQMRVAALDLVVARHPYLAEAYRARAIAWRDLANGRTGFAGPRLDRAERDLSSALRLRPSWGEAWADLGWTRWMRGDFPGARAAMDRALSLDRTHPHIARSHEQLLAWLDSTDRAVSAAPK
jgi:Flp pilus assembly protein TadD